MRADDIPVARTPPSGWTVMPAPILAGCTEPLVPGAPDLRGTWRAIAVEVDGARAPDDYGPFIVVTLERARPRERATDPD